MVSSYGSLQIASNAKIHLRQSFDLTRKGLHPPRILIEVQMQELLDASTARNIIAGCALPERPTGSIPVRSFQIPSEAFGVH